MMKTRDRVAKAGMLIISVLLLMSNLAASQQAYAGHWEGTFMGDFKTVLQIDVNDENSYTGKIQMYSGGSIIQDDELSKFTFEAHHISFYIQAKESEFDGSFNEALTELSGHFIFPDQSQHPVTLYRVQDKRPDNRTSQANYLENRDKTIPAGALIADVNFLMKNLIENHPQLYYYTDEELFEKRSGNRP